MLTFGETGCGTSRCLNCVDYFGVTESVGMIVNVAVATYGTSIGGVTAVYTVGSGYFCAVVVTKCCYSFLCNESFITYGTVLTFGKTGCGTGRSYCLVDNLGVSKSCYSFLSNESFATYGTVLTFSKTGCKTGRSYCLVDSFGVTESCYGFLSNESFVTYGTVLTFSKTGCGTGRSYCLVNTLGVTKCVNGFLCNENLVTYGAVLTLGKTCCSTSGCYRLVDRFGMTKCVNNFLRNENLVTYGTMLTYGKTGCSTSGCYRLVDNLSMTKSVAFIYTVIITTHGTGVGGITTVYTIRSGRRRLIAMSKCSYYLGVGMGCIILTSIHLHTVIITGRSENLSA